MSEQDNGSCLDYAISEVVKSNFANRFAAMKESRDEAWHKNTELTGLISDIEWVVIEQWGTMIIRKCPYCRQSPLLDGGKGHDKNCKIAAVLVGRKPSHKDDQPYKEEY